MAAVDSTSRSRNTLPVCLDGEKPNRLVSLWWVMHHSDDPDLQALAVTCYLDESATDGSTPTAVVGGLLVNSSHFFGLDPKWRAMLDEFHLWPGLHMKDFGRNNRFGGMPREMRRAILTRAVDIIKAHNICTLAATLEYGQYKAILPATVRRGMSAYGLCFIACVLGNHQIAEGNKYDKRIAFIVDSGNTYAEHVFFAHQGLVEIQTEEDFLNLGSLTFDKDDNVSALQAADVVCWAVRRRASGYPFSNGFEPLEGILNDQAHNEADFSEIAMRELVGRLDTLSPEIWEDP
jgi:hypothetical protein